MSKLFGIAFADTDKLNADDTIPGTDKEKIINLMRNLFEYNTFLDGQGCGFMLVGSSKIQCGRSVENGQKYSGHAMFKEFFMENLKTHTNLARFYRSTAVLANILNRTTDSGKKSAASQPIVCDSIVGVANCITQDTTQVFTNHINHFTKGYNSDSEAIVKLFNYYFSDDISNDIVGSVQDSLKKTVNELYGDIALVCVSRHDPNKIIAFKTTGTLAIWHYPTLGLTLFSSDQKQTKRALEAIYLSHCKEDAVDISPEVDSGLIIDTSYNTYTTFKVDRSGNK